MVSAASFQKLALNFQEVVEQPHFEKTSFRVKGKIFATMDSMHHTATLKLDAIDQSVYCLVSPVFAVPATGAWGKHGWTKFDLSKVTKSILAEALDKAYKIVAPKGKSLVKPSNKSAQLIQTLHPDPGKVNKRISVEKYNTIKAAVLKILVDGELTHTELMERLYLQVKDNFEGGIQWYGETVKLDLEARNIIERMGPKPEKYKLTGKPKKSTA